MNRTITARFLISNSDPAKCPSPDRPEYAFIGRSNVGKSSLINNLANKKGLAKISSKPGKTQLINHFGVDEEWYLVDLPGYGYAKVSKKDRETWGKATQTYLTKRSNLMCIMVLIDGRLTPQKIDLEFMIWLGERGLPFAMVFTKTDKMTKNALKTVQEIYRETMLETWEELPRSFLTSANTGRGRDELLDFFAETNTLWEKP